MVPTPCTIRNSKNIVKRKHVTLTISDKLKVIKRVECGESRKKIMEDFNIGASTISNIIKAKTKLQRFVASGQSMMGSDIRKTMKKPKLEELDEAVYTWFTSKRAEGKPVSGLMITEKAKQFCSDMDIEKDVKFSDGWLRSFKLRHGIRAIDVAGEKESANHETATNTKFFSAASRT
ncbi:hypothetical protein Pcinc_041373 [Petrolisthes cinctipes]|uniref:HTH CENPB-type domain-containing protein n=1 Tax=Petrolisthes cinctipes TaxID=88211 RepID=A0AAE1BJP2_PETCI|nr:hypothetical protein Pcinc_041373 [Petrolisthes cinctipes]